MRDFLDPWPVAPNCSLCHREATISYYDEKLRQTVVKHADGSPPCSRTGGSPYQLRGDGNIVFPLRFLAEFLALDKASVWAASVARRDNKPVYVGYVRAPDGHRKLGRVERAEHAVATANPDQPAELEAPTP